MANWPRLLAFLVGGLALIAILLGFWSVSHVTEDEEAMALSTSSKTLERAIPPLDAAAPATVKTATFALG